MSEPGDFMSAAVAAAGPADGLALLAEDPGRSALLVDFDGTVSPIVADPAAAAPLPGAGAVLGRLSERLGVVGVVSGRPVAFLRDRLAGVAGALSLVGLYGLEWVEGGELHTHPGAEGWRMTLADVAREASRSTPAGVTVEDKGLAVTLHARSAPEQLGWVEDFAAAATSRHGLAAHPGRLSVELRPPVEVDKGTVLARFGEGRTAIAYLGDDRGDLPAFAALAALRAEGVATVAVAVWSDEAPPELLDAADLVLAGPAGALAVLVGLADRLDAGPPPGRVARSGGRPEEPGVGSAGSDRR